LRLLEEGLFVGFQGAVLRRLLAHPLLQQGGGRERGRRGYEGVEVGGRERGRGGCEEVGRARWGGVKERVLKGVRGKVVGGE